MKRRASIFASLVSLSLLATVACSGAKTCEEIKAEYKEENAAIASKEGRLVEFYDALYKAYTKEFEEAECRGVVTS
jgi:hypothetical protein